MTSRAISPPFVLTKPGAEAGERLIDIVTRKEAERIAGKKNTFWWGIGSSLGAAVRNAAEAAAGCYQRLMRLRGPDIVPVPSFWRPRMSAIGGKADIGAFQDFLFTVLSPSVGSRGVGPSATRFH
jgi:hypothetical protein